MLQESLVVSKEKPSSYFWPREHLYIREWRMFLTDLPMFRVLFSAFNVYAFVYGCIFASTLCTAFGQFCVVVSTLVGCTYLGWATWWDEACYFPVTWTYLKRQNFNAFWIVFWLLFTMVQKMMATFICVLLLICNFVNLGDAFNRDCFN